MPSSNSLKILAVSDGTGETVQTMLRAALVQFDAHGVEIERFGKIRTRESLEQILLKAKDCGGMVVATLVNAELRVFLLSRSLQLEVKVVDVLFPLMETLSTELGKPAAAKPGLLRQLDSDYFRRVGAMEFTVRHDDGCALQDLADADIVLIGVSRTSKTPLSMYLGLKGYKVANIPLVHGIEPPKELFSIPQEKIIALIIDADRLAAIRTARIQTLGSDDRGGDYAEMSRIMDELEWSRSLFKQNRRWPVLDVTSKAVEENAVEIERIYLNRLRAAAQLNQD